MSVPDSIDYTSILPMAVESRVRRRGFVPSNGASFVSNQNNIIEIPMYVRGCVCVFVFV